MAKIKAIHGREILDSRGNPTVEAKVLLDDGSSAFDSSPSGASTGKFEVVELRDKDPKRYNGLGVSKAVENVNQTIQKELKGREASDQRKIDWLMKELDGKVNKSRLGANAILAVSLAVCRASALSDKKPLYKYLAERFDFPQKEFTLPCPLFNVINGGRHAQNKLSVQEFMIIPKQELEIEEKIRLGAEIYHQLKDLIKEKGYQTGVGDEGGFAPDIENPGEALEMIIQAGKRASYTARDDFTLGLDVAASEFSKQQDQGFQYQMQGFDPLDSKGLANYLIELTSSFPISSIEDPLDQEDWLGWQYLTEKAGQKIQIVGDDLFATNKERLKEGVEKKAANAILIKLNQIGTLTETVETIKEAQKSHYQSVISHRSGETEDVFIADLAVGSNSSQIKSGALARSERVATYNQLLRIKDELNE